MESSGSLPFDSFKSKKIIRSSSSSKPSPSDQTTKAYLDQSPWSTKTPEKPVNPPRRLRNRRAALWVKEVREVPAKLQKSDQDRCHQSDPVSSDGQQIGSGRGDTPSGKPKEKVDGPIKLPEKRFSYGHLAQLKFILPEVVETKKVLIHDEQTSCMKPDLYVTLNVGAIKNEGKLKLASGNSHMQRVFPVRLWDFFKAHPEVEVPEETLPEPFNQSKEGVPISLAEGSKTLTDELAEQQPAAAAAAASHLSLSFRKRFSLQVSHNEAIDIYQEQLMVSLQPLVLPVSEPHFDQSSSEEQTSASAAPSVCKFSLKPTTSQKYLSLGASQGSVALSHPPATLMEERDSVKSEVSSSIGTATIHGTPAKLVSTPIKLMSATPELQPPKRFFMSPDDDSTSSPSKLVTRAPRSRSLKFDTPVKNAMVEDEVNKNGGLSVDNDIFEILPENLLHSIREKEQKALEEQDPAISRVKIRQQMIASLPKLFDMIRFLFQSIKCSVITKRELMHRIMANHLDIVDRREVEEYLKLLQELVPEWIYEKSAPSGDLLICINKISRPEFMHARLVEAK